MLTMLKADFYRIFKGRLGGITVIILALLGMFVGQLADLPMKEVIGMTLAAGAVFIPIMLTIILMITWGHELNYRTLNNVLIGGVSRLQFFVGKFLLMTSLVVIFLGIYAASLSVGLLIFEGGLDLGSILTVLAAQFPIYLALTCLGMLLFLLFNTSHLAIMFYLVIVFLGDNLYGMLITNFLQPLDFTLNYMLVSNLNNLASFSQLDTNTVVTCVVSGAVMALAFAVISYQIFRKKEFK